MKKTGFNKIFICLTAGVLLLGVPEKIRAHPHVWIDVVTDLIFTKNGQFIGLKHSWTFDESYSVLAVQGLDKNKNRKLTSKELAPLLKQSLNSLKKWDYFSYVKVNGKPVALKKLRNPTIHYRKGKVEMEFELRMNKPFDARKNEIKLTVYDRSFYNLVSFAEKDPIWLSQYAPEDCGFIIEPSKKGNRESTTVADSYIESLGDDVNYGAQFAEWVKLDCSPR